MKTPYLVNTLANEINYDFIYTDWQNLLTWVKQSPISINNGLSFFYNQFFKYTKDKNFIVLLDSIDLFKPSNENEISLLDYILSIGKWYQNENMMHHLIVITTSNYPYNIDDKFFSTGLFKEKIYIGLPNLNDRKNLTQNLLNNFEFENNNYSCTKIAELLKNANIQDIIDFCEQLKQRVLNKTIKEKNTFESSLKISQSDIEIVWKNFKLSTNFKDLEKIKEWELDSLKNLK